MALLAEWQYRRLPELPTTLTEIPSASVDIIVPARNETLNIERVVRSLLRLHYPAFRVNVIDDQSSDDTAAKANYEGVELVRLDSEPPPDWTGKCNACEIGARRSEADWLLFTDADTEHAPDSLACAIAYAESHRLDALSLLLRQECIGFWECVILPLAYQNFFAVLRPNRPAFNGQYILIKREVYLQSGGFGAVRGRIMEDVALAELLTGQGRSIALVNGHCVASVRMYRTLPELLRGMTKTTFAAARDRGKVGWLLGGVTFAGVFVILMALFGLIMRLDVALLGSLLVWLIVTLGLLPWMRRFGVHPAPLYALLNPLGIVVLWLIGMVSTLRVLSGAGVRWKDRTVVETRSAITK